jgi:hypothetical protein
MFASESSSTTGQLCGTANFTTICGARLLSPRMSRLQQLHDQLNPSQG